MEKKFAVLGDIHSNIEALSAVVEDARSRSVTDFVCVGDIVGYNANPNECVDLIRELNCFTVRGNHDHYCAYDESLDDFHPMAASVIAWTRRQLVGDRAQWLKALPLHAFHQGLTLVHSTLDMPERWGYVFDSIEAESHFFYQNTQICFHGHTHVPVIFQKHGANVVRYDPQNIHVSLGRKYFVNTGSVGQPRDNDSRASYCIYDPTQREIQFHRVEYDVQAAQEKIRKAGLPERLAQRISLGR